MIKIDHDSNANPFFTCYVNTKKDYEMQKTIRIFKFNAYKKTTYCNQRFFVGIQSIIAKEQNHVYKRALQKLSEEDINSIFYEEDRDLNILPDTKILIDTGFSISSIDSKFIKNAKYSLETNVANYYPKRIGNSFVLEKNGKFKVINLNVNFKKGEDIFSRNIIFSVVDGLEEKFNLPCILGNSFLLNHKITIAGKFAGGHQKKESELKLFLSSRKE